MVLPPSHRSSWISCPLERYLGMLTEDLEEIFFVGDKDHGDTTRKESFCDEFIDDGNIFHHQ